MQNYFKKISIILLLLVGLCAPRAHASLFNLDSIAALGKFPKFCVDTYRWGDRFFNGYDTLYVEPAGYKFNIKLKSDSWLDYYNFRLPQDVRMSMVSDPSTSMGVWLTYLAVSVGYDINVSKILGFSPQSRKRFNFGFNCSLFAADAYFVSNDVATNIRRFSVPDYKFHPHSEFNGINTKTWGINTYYFFNHKRYSQAAAFNFSRIQRKSQGSFFAGLSIYTQHFDFNFNRLPNNLKILLPDNWSYYTYKADSHNYALKLGYGYNWVLGPHWLIGISESPMLGLKKGYINSNKEGTSFALSNSFRASAVWNNKQWFLGIFGDFDSGLIYDREHTFANAVLTGSVSVGYRFNLW